MRTLEEKVAAYNSYAIKHDYECIEIDYENKEIKGTFSPKDENKYHGFIGFFKNFVTAYHNGYLKEDYDEIVKEMKKL